MIQSTSELREFSMKTVLHGCGCLFVLALHLASSRLLRADLIGPTPYRSFADSPFSGGQFSQFYLETFESGGLTTPGVTPSVGTVLAPGALTDSVDSDDGAIDGFGKAGHSYYVYSPNITFTFNQAALGSFPTAVGIVFTDVGFTLDGGLGVGSLSFEAFDPDGHSLGSVGPVTVGDGLAGGQTAEDRFFGATNAAGISKFTISMNSDDWEVDHLQYGVAVPETASAWRWAPLLAILILGRSAKSIAPSASPPRSASLETGVGPNQGLDRPRAARLSHGHHCFARAHGRHCLAAGYPRRGSPLGAAVPLSARTLLPESSQRQIVAKGLLHSAVAHGRSRPFLRSRRPARSRRVNGIQSRHYHMVLARGVAAGQDHVVTKPHATN